MKGYTPTPISFRGASKLNKDKREYIQRIIDFELSELRGIEQKEKG